MFVATLAPSTAAAGADEAREYSKKAKKAYTEGDYERAAELLEKAYSEEANLTYQYNRIRALEGAGKYEKALEVMKTYERPMLDAKGFENVPDLKASLEEKVGTDAEGDEAVDSLADSREDTTAADDEGTDETDDETDQTDTVGTASTADGSGPSSMEIVGWSVSGVGVGVLTLGTLYSTMLFLPSDIRTRVRNDRDLRSQADLEKFRNQQLISGVLLGAGALTTIGGGVILLTEMMGDDESSAAALRDGPKVAPFVTVDGGGGAVLNFQF